MTLSRWLVLGAAAVYMLALALPAVQGSGFPSLSGIEVLRQGASAWRSGVLAWFANPMFGFALVLAWIGGYRAALGAALFGLLLGLSSFVAAPIAERAGRTVPEFSYATGFYVWLTAFLILAAGALAGIYKVSKGVTS